MILNFKNKCIHDIKGNIVLPDTGFFALNENCLRLCYMVDGRFLYITIPSRLSVANYLVDNGIIDSFGIVSSNEIILYRHSFYWDFDHHNKPVMLMNKVVVPWEKVKLTRNDVQLLAARQEFERCTAGIPLEKAATMYTPAKYNY